MILKELERFERAVKSKKNQIEKIYNKDNLDFLYRVHLCDFKSYLSVENAIYSLELTKDNLNSDKKYINLLFNKLKVILFRVEFIDCLKNDNKQISIRGFNNYNLVTHEIKNHVNYLFTEFIKSGKDSLTNYSYLDFDVGNAYVKGIFYKALEELKINIFDDFIKNDAGLTFRYDIKFFKEYLF